MRRDTQKRGYTPEQVKEELRKREPDSREFIRPQRQLPTSWCSSARRAKSRRSEANGHLDVRLVLRPTIPHPDMTYLADVEGPDAGIRLLLGRDTGKPVDILEIDGSVTARQTARLADTIWNHLTGVPRIGADQFGAYQDRGEIRHSDPLALTQLLLTYHLLRETVAGTQRLFAAPVAALSRVQTAQGRNAAAAADANILTL